MPNVISNALLLKEINEMQANNQTSNQIIKVIIWWMKIRDEKGNNNNIGNKVCNERVERMLD